MTLRNFVFLLTALLGCAWLGTGCGSSESADREWTSTPPPDTIAQQRKTSFETRTDTVTAQANAQRGMQISSAYNASPVRFSIQVGSYSVAKNANSAQILARQRYPLPVVNEYNALRRLYQIRIGFFETEEAAKEFRLQLVADHPAEYKDAWVVKILKQ